MDPPKACWPSWQYLDDCNTTRLSPGFLLACPAHTFTSASQQSTMYVRYGALSVASSGISSYTAESSGCRSGPVSGCFDLSVSSLHITPRLRLHASTSPSHLACIRLLGSACPCASAKDCPTVSWPSLVESAPSSVGVCCAKAFLSLSRPNHLHQLFLLLHLCHFHHRVASTLPLGCPGNT